MALTLTGPPIQVTFRFNFGENTTPDPDPDPDPGTDPTPDTPSILTLSIPSDGAVVVSSTPTFGVAVTLDSQDRAVYTIDVQYDSTDTFDNATTISKDFAAVDGGAFLTATSAVPATTYWRAQMRQADTIVAEWTSAHSFTVDADITASTLPVTWSVSSSAERPIHLWHFDPPAALTGDVVTVYGQGFPATGKLLFGDTQVSTDSWALVPATDSLTGADRAIAAGTVDCEHYEIRFAAPATDGPGDAITVEA